MKIKIVETGEVKELFFISEENNTCRAEAFLTNHEAYSDIDEDYHYLTMETYKWWAEFFDRFEEAEDAVSEFKSSLGGEQRSAFERKLQDEIGHNDLEDQPAAMLSIMEEFEKELAE